MRRVDLGVWADPYNGTLWRAYYHAQLVTLSPFPRVAPAQKACTTRQVRDLDEATQFVATFYAPASPKARRVKAQVGGKHA